MRKATPFDPLEVGEIDISPSRHDFD